MGYEILDSLKLGANASDAAHALAMPWKVAIALHTP